jgi:hypothetical protein
MSVDPSLDAWPPVSLQRLSESVAALAARVSEPDVKTQLHALSAVLANVGAERDGAPERARLIGRLELRLAREEGVNLQALRRLARLDRAAVHPVDWSAASSG